MKMFQTFCINVCSLSCIVQRLNKKIKKLQESELTLKDMDSEDTNYILEDKCVTFFICVTYEYIHAILTTHVVMLHNNSIFNFNVRQQSLPLLQYAILCCII